MRRPDKPPPMRPDELPRMRPDELPRMRPDERCAMNDCRRIAERLTSYADNALPADERAAIDRHLAACPPCRRAAVHEQGGRTLLRECSSRLKGDALPPGLRTRCEALARDYARRRATPAWRAGLLRGVLSALIILVAGGLTLSFATHRSDTVLAAQLTADHVKCFRIFAKPDSPGLGAADVEQGIPPSSPEQGVQLIGARRCVYADGMMRHVMYRVNGKNVSLYMLDGMRRLPAELNVFGHRSRIWSRGETTYVLVSSDWGPDFARAEQYVMQQAQ
jgi:anti-sigma factor RsiW